MSCRTGLIWQEIVGPGLRDVVTKPSSPSRPSPPPSAPSSHPLVSVVVPQHHYPTPSSPWADTPTICCFPFSLYFIQRVRTSTKTISQRKKQTHPSTRSSGFTSSFKLPSGGSSSPLAWCLAYHVAAGTSHCRCAPQVLPRFTSPTSLSRFVYRKSCLTISHRASCSMQHFATSVCGHRAHIGRLHTRALAWRPGIPRKRACAVRQHPAFAHRDTTRSRRVPQAAHPRADAATLGRARARDRGQVVPGVRMDTDALWRDRIPRILSRRRAWAVSRALYHGA